MDMTFQGVQRFDLGEIKSMELTPQGFLKVPGFATRTGVFTYKDAKGNVRRELRHPDDVFSPESLATLKYAPVTNDHPPKMLTPENVKQYSVGHATERVEVNRDLVETDLIIEDANAIKAVQDGKRELSAGYLADLIPEKGTYNGAEYDFRQKNIKNNHIALVARGRAGPEVRLRMDSNDAVLSDDVETPAAEFTTSEQDADGTAGGAEEGQNESAKTIVLSGRELEVPEWAAEIIQAMTDRYDQLRGQTMKLEEQAMATEQKKDADISQKGISPQVDVTQMAPDGRNAAGKTGAGDRSGPAKAKGDDEGDEKKEDKKDDDKPGEKPGEKKDYEGLGGEGTGGSPVQQLKDAMAAMQSEHQGKMDAMQAKLDDAMANSSMGGGEMKMDSAEWRTSVRKRVSLERTAGAILPEAQVAKFDTMSDDEIRAACIKHKHPEFDLRDKSSVYLEARFDSITERVASSARVRRDMGSRVLQSRMDGESPDPRAKRNEMMNGGRQEWQQSLSASKK